MGPLLRFWNSTVGKKVVMAVTGVGLLAFVFLHMAGNLQMFLGADAMHKYAVLLRTSEELLWVARIGLIVMAVLHVISAYQLTRINNAARPVDYAKREPQVSTLASRTMRWGGVFLLAFIVYHLGHMTTGWFNESLVHLQPYSNVILGFQSPWIVLFYVVAMVFLGLHLFHGAWAGFRTLGLQKRSAEPIQRSVALWFAIIVWAGFTVIPVAVFLGILN